MDFKERWTPAYEVLLYSFSLRRIKVGKVAGSLVICRSRYFQETLFNKGHVIRGYLVIFCPRIASFK